MDSLPNSFDDASVKKIAEAVRRVLRLPRNQQRPWQDHDDKRSQRAFYLVQSSAFVLSGNTGSNFSIYSGTAGSESATNYTSVSCYVRYGCVYANNTYIALEINGVLEILNPTLLVRGTIASDAAPDSNSSLTVYAGSYGSETTTGTSIGNVRNASDCTLKSGGGAKVHSAMFDLSVGSGGLWQFVVGRTA